MRVLIEEYRGWEIYFDTESEDFYTASNEYDKQSAKKSFASTKKFIDDYIKDNNEFKPILVQRMSSHYNSDSVIELIGIRKDNIFMYKDSNGKKQQLSEYYEKDYFLVDESNDDFFKEIEKIECEINKLRSKKQDVSAKIKKVTVKEIKEKLLK